jgi:hypothetical protein
MVSFVILIGTLRVNVLFVLLFFGLVMLFLLRLPKPISHTFSSCCRSEVDLDLLDWSVDGKSFRKFTSYSTPAVANTSLHRYLAILEVCETVQIPCPLPVFDLSSKIFPGKNKGV